ncbi:hypothetical protein HN51_007913, partial [Arachis hypogaea]
MIAASFSFLEQWLNRQQEFKQQQQPVEDRIANKENLESPEPSSSLIKILKIEFECLPGYMKGLATWERLRAIYELRLNSPTTFEMPLEERNCRKGRFSPAKLKGKRVIELGAGYGVSGFGN